MNRAAAPSAWSALDARVEVLAPASARQDLVRFLDRTSSSGGATPGTPFAPERVDAIQALSEAFLASPELRADPASVAVAYWMRRAQVARHQAEYDRRVHAEELLVRVPVGRVFHVAPANVDTLFLYSWALAFLCGNASVVRLSQQRGAIVDAMLGAIRDVAASHAVLRDGNRFVTYTHEDEVTTALSAWCSHRVVWGGDETVAAVRSLPLHPHASERTFGSKFSYSAFSAARFLAIDAGGRERLAAALFNDLFWFDQMACSSPHILFWVGSESESEAAARALEASLQADLDRRGFVPSAASAVQRRAFAFELAADADVRVSFARPGFVSVQVRDELGLVREISGGGLIRHARIGALGDLSGFARESDQTVTHFGFDAGELRALAEAVGPRGVDRIVPVGEALAFDTVWDGYDLIDDFTRLVRVKPA